MSRALGKLYFRKRDIDNAPGRGDGMNHDHLNYGSIKKPKQAPILRESTIRKQILDYLNSLPESHFIINRPGAESGEADITGCIKGRRCEFEVKKPGERARKLQVTKLYFWRSAGAIAEVVRSVDDVREEVKDLL